MTRLGGNNIFHVLAVYDWNLDIFQQLVRLMLKADKRSLLLDLLRAQNAKGFTPVAILHEICLAGMKDATASLIPDVFGKYEDAVADRVLPCEFGRKTAIFAVHKVSNTVLERRTLIHAKYHLEASRMRQKPWSLEPDILLAAEVWLAAEDPSHSGPLDAAGRSTMLPPSRHSQLRTDSSPSAMDRKLHKRRSRSDSQLRIDSSPSGARRKPHRKRSASPRTRHRSSRTRSRSREQLSPFLHAGSSQEKPSLAHLMAAGLISTDLARLVRKGELTQEEAAAMSIVDHKPNA